MDWKDIYRALRNPEVFYSHAEINPYYCGKTRKSIEYDSLNYRIKGLSGTVYKVSVRVYPNLKVICVIEIEDGTGKLLDKNREVVFDIEEDFESVKMKLPCISDSGVDLTPELQQIYNWLVDACEKVLPE